MDMNPEIKLEPIDAEMKFDHPLISRMLSEKGHELIVVDNYKYRKYRVAKRSGETCWCCTKKNCLGKIFTKGKDLEITQFRGVHSHQPLSPAVINRQQINNAITLTARKYPTVGISGIQKRNNRRIQLNRIVSNGLDAKDVRYIEKNATRAQQVKKNPAEEMVVLEPVQPDRTPEEPVQPLRMIEEVEINESDGHELDSNDFEYEDIKIFPDMDPLDICSYKIGFVGGGNMATAIATGLLKSEQIKPEQLWISSATEATRKRWKEDLKVNTAEDNGKIFSQCDIVILAVKPQVLDDALSQAFNNFSRPNDHAKFFVVSVLAGVTLETLKEKLKPLKPIQIIRTMPNTPLMVGEGITVYSYEDAPKVTSSYEPEFEDKIVKSIFSPMGIAEKVPEKQINAISALSGSGPAYMYMMIEALADGAVKMGVPRAMANKYAAQVMVGAGKMVLETGKHPGLLKDEVCSPNGTTITGIHALERGGVRGHLMNAIEAATKRSDELSKSS